MKICYFLLLLDTQNFFFRERERKNFWESFEKKKIKLFLKYFFQNIKKIETQKNVNQK